MKLPALVADYPERLHVSGLQDAAELGPVAGGLDLGCQSQGQKYQANRKIYFISHTHTASNDLAKGKGNKNRTTERAHDGAEVIT